MLVVPIAQDGCLPTTKCKIANTYRKKRALLFAAGAFQTLEHSSSTCFELKAVTEAEKQTVTLKDDRIETEACYKTLCAAFNKTATTATTSTKDIRVSSDRQRAPGTQQSSVIQSINFAS